MAANGLSTLPPPEWIERIFLRFQTLYGNRAATMWADIPKAELIATWRDYLDGFSGDDLRNAIEAMGRAYTEFPPTLPQFVNLCKDARNRRTQTTLALPEPRGPIPPELGAIVHGFGTPGRGDCKAWARKILEESAAGRVYPSISIEFAKEAFGIAA
jgi:hypothetical protein